MITPENAALLKGWAADANKAIKKADKVTRERNDVIRDALAIGVTVAEVVAATGLTRARIYQIRDRR